MTRTGHNLVIGILSGLAVGSAAASTRADWAPGPPDCRDQGLSCDDAGPVARFRLERDHVCSCNPEVTTGSPAEEDDAGCSCSTPGSSRRELPLSLLVLGLAAASGALVRDRRR